jgi:transposase
MASSLTSHSGRPRPDPKRGYFPTLDAVALVRGGRTITEVARDLGVSKWSLGHWVRRAEEGQMLSEPKTLALETPERRELRRLRQELEYVSRQRDILKKALGILSAEMAVRAAASLTPVGQTCSAF